MIIGMHPNTEYLTILIFRSKFCADCQKKPTEWSSTLKLAWRKILITHTQKIIVYSALGSLMQDLKQWCLVKMHLKTNELLMACGDSLKILKSLLTTESLTLEGSVLSWEYNDYGSIQCSH